MSGRSLAVLGAGGHARVVADCAEQAGWSGIVLFDGSGLPPPAGPWPLVGTPQDLMARLAEFDGVIVGIGDNAERLDGHRRLADAGARMACLIHPRASVSPHVEVGAGCLILAGACVGVGARLGQAVIVNTNATVEHDDDLADGVHVSSGAVLAGGVRVGERGWIGAGAVVRPGVVIGHDARVGAGAAVVADVADGLTVVGVPARRLDR